MVGFGRCIEGGTPDIGKRRENIIRAFLEIELGVKVISAPPMERDWDFQVVFIESGTQNYSLKTTENITTLKVAWNGFLKLNVQESLNLNIQYFKSQLIDTQRRFLCSFSI